MPCINLICEHQRTETNECEATEEIMIYPIGTANNSGKTTAAGGDNDNDNDNGDNNNNRNAGYHSHVPSQKLSLSEVHDNEEHSVLGGKTMIFNGKISTL